MGRSVLKLEAGEEAEEAEEAETEEGAGSELRPEEEV